MEFKEVGELDATNSDDQSKSHAIRLVPHFMFFFQGIVCSKLNPSLASMIHVN